MESSNEERQLNERDDNLHQLPVETTRENRVSTKREGEREVSQWNKKKLIQSKRLLWRRSVAISCDDVSLVQRYLRFKWVSYLKTELLQLLHVSSSDSKKHSNSQVMVDRWKQWRTRTKRWRAAWERHDGWGQRGRGRQKGKRICVRWVMYKNYQVESRRYRDSLCCSTINNDYETKHRNQKKKEKERRRRQQASRDSASMY